ncbi:hypothetical protein JXB31_04305 [Candidatus Woesearchaeota archaeon]|nr:hypothetical protein [Candidatus Woesearchaeota archaeon]
MVGTDNRAKVPARQVAVKSWISDIINGRYVKEEGDWNPNYVITQRKIRVSRTNILGVMVSEPAVDPGHYSFVIDDGSSKITVRSFDDKPPKDIAIGDVIKIIGRPREFGSEIYIMPEIIKKIDNNKYKWLEHWKLELETLYRGIPLQDITDEETHGSSQAQKSRMEKAPLSEEFVEDLPETAKLAENATRPLDSKGSYGNHKKKAEKPDDNAAQTSSNPIDLILEIIRKSDKGDGTDTENVISDSALKREKAELIINNLLMDGEIFEVKPGKLKVME